MCAPVYGIRDYLLTLLYKEPGINEIGVIGRMGEIEKIIILYLSLIHI